MSNIPSQVIDVTSIQEFNNYLTEFRENLIILTFYTRTCSICKSFAPHFTSAQQEFEPKGVLFARINATDNPLITQQFQIQGVPFTLFIKDKEAIHSFTGGASPTQFRSVINDVLQKHFGMEKKISPDSYETMYM